MYHIGQKVVCINADTDFNKSLQRLNVAYVGDLDGLTKGNIYTITGIIFNEVAYLKPMTILILKEITRKGKENWGFDSERFRPLKKTNIEIFKKMLVDIPKMEEVDVNA